MMAQIHLIKSASNTLAPATSEASDYIRRLQPGIMLKCDIRQARNYRFHKLFFSLLNLGFQYWTPIAGAVSESEKRLLRDYVDYLISMTGLQNILDETLDVWLARAGHRRADGVELVKSFEAYRKWAVITAGFFDEFILPDGTIRREARSISFAIMSEVEFREVYKAVLNVLWLHILNRPFNSPQEAENAAAQLWEYAA
ncbi:DUF1367 family protein [Pantoea agglomerans]|uniref:DUF1367 family protein n=1 Tax=Enterobacter agglomerans TaxID=549 RepID=UPI001F15038D|nr:DUF1367 family protein [Pantoea agglomerans]